MTNREALDQALAELEALSSEELRAELDKHRNGWLSGALKEAASFLYPPETLG